MQPHDVRLGVIAQELELGHKGAAITSDQRQKQKVTCSQLRVLDTRSSPGVTRSWFEAEK